MYRDSPDVDENIETQVQHLVEREEEGVDVVREPLQESVHWVEGVARKGSWDFPYVVRFVKELSKNEMEEFIDQTCF